MSESGSFGVNPTKAYNVDSIPTLPAKLGDIGSDTRGTFIFCKAAEAITQYDFVSVKDDYTVVQMDDTEANTTPRYFGAAQVGLALNEYAWIWVGGEAGGGTGTGIKGRFINYTAKATVYTTATPGVCDDASGGSFDKLPLVVGLTTVGGTAAAAELQSWGILKLTN